MLAERASDIGPPPLGGPPMPPAPIRETAPCDYHRLPITLAQSNQLDNSKGKMHCSFYQSFVKFPLAAVDSESKSSHYITENKA